MAACDTVMRALRRKVSDSNVRIRKEELHVSHSRYLSHHSNRMTAVSLMRRTASQDLKKRTRMSALSEYKNEVRGGRNAQHKYANRK